MTASGAVGDLAAQVAMLESQVAELTARRDALAAEVGGLEQRAAKAREETEREKTRAGLHRAEIADMCDRLTRALDRIGEGAAA